MLIILYIFIFITSIYLYFYNFYLCETEALCVNINTESLKDLINNSCQLNSYRKISHS